MCSDLQGLHRRTLCQFSNQTQCMMSRSLRQITPLYTQALQDSGDDCELLVTIKTAFLPQHTSTTLKRQASVAIWENKMNKSILVRQTLPPKQTPHHLTSNPFHKAFQTMSRIPTKFLLHRLVDIIKRFVILSSTSRASTYGGESKICNSKQGYQQKPQHRKVCSIRPNKKSDLA